MSSKSLAKQGSRKPDQITRAASDDEDEVEEVPAEEDDREEPERSESSDDGKQKPGENEEDGENGQSERARLKAVERRRKQRLAALQEAQAAEAQQVDAQQRLRQLQAQVEAYTETGAGTPVKKVASRGGPRRGRVREQEEDAEMVQDEAAGAQAAVTFSSTPPYIKGGEMRDYQVAGLNWLIKLRQQHYNGILADEMGLGKTLQTISFIGFLKHTQGVKEPFLVVTPKSTLGNWMREFGRWLPSVRVTKLHGSQEERAAQKQNEVKLGSFDVCLTTYEIAIREKAHLRKIHWSLLVVDEAHRIKNEQSVLAQVVRLYRTDNRLLLTGTPLQNNLHELWALLNFLLPEVFHSSEQFDQWFDLKGEGEVKQFIERLHQLLRQFMLRRLKSDVEKSLPPKKEIKLFVGLSDMQKQWYKKILLRDLEAVNGGGGTGKGSKMRLLNIAMQLRKASNHPYLFDGAEPTPFTNGPHLIANAGKMQLLDKLLPRLQAQGSRVLIFSQMTRMLDILEDYLLMRKYNYCRIDGSTVGEERDAAIESFNAPGSDKFVFLLSTRAGGLGINLATADIVVLYDSDWNPQMDLQAQDRAHRIGQKKQVMVYRLVTEGTIEEKIVERAETKLHLDALVIQQGRLLEQNKALAKDELLHMIKFGADHIFQATGASGTALTDEDIEVILSRGEQKTAASTAKLKENTPRLLDFALDGSGGNSGSLYLFQGVDYKDKDKPVGGSGFWIEPPKRERKLLVPVERPTRAGEPKKAPAPRPPKQPVIHDHQFYPVRLSELLEKETSAFRRRIEAQKKRDEAEEKRRQEGGTDAADKLVDKPTDEGAEDFGELTAEEEAEKASLLTQGFSDWSKRDFNAFVRACEQYGRRDYKAIAAEVETKDETAVQRYAEVFFERYREVPDGEGKLKRIEEGEARLARRDQMVQALDTKIKRYKNPLSSLEIQYGTKKGKTYVEEEDVFLVCMTHQLGYGNWDALKAAIRRAWQFRFDWFLKSRSPQELGRRVDILIRCIEKEEERRAAANGTAVPAPGKRGRKPAVTSGDESAIKRTKSDPPASTQPLSKRRRTPVAAAAKDK